MRQLVEPVPVESFRAYLRRQPEERRQQILLGERAYVNSKRPYGAEGSDRYITDPVREAFEDSMFGYEETPAGSQHEGVDTGPEI
jgi:hypothetical protein